MVGGGQAKAALICGIVGIVLNVASMIAGAIIDVVVTGAAMAVVGGQRGEQQHDQRDAGDAREATADDRDARGRQ